MQAPQPFVVLVIDRYLDSLYARINDCFWVQGFMHAFSFGKCYIRYQLRYITWSVARAGCGNNKSGHNVACANGVIVRRSVNLHDLLPPCKLAYRVIRSSLKIMGNA
jgi:hypothetical protein